MAEDKSTYQLDAIGLASITLFFALADILVEKGILTRTEVGELLEDAIYKLDVGINQLSEKNPLVEDAKRLLETHLELFKK